MVPRGQPFSLEAAAENLIQMWKAMINEPNDRVQYAEKMLQWCLESPSKILKEALTKGMEESDPVSGAPPPGPGGATMPQNDGKRPLVRSDTNEEFERLKKKKDMWELKVEVAEMQRRVAAGAEGPREQKNQADATRAEKRVDARAEKQADMEEVVSVITKALQQHPIACAGGQQPNLGPSPVAAGTQEWAAVLSKAAAHFQEWNQSFGSAAGTVPAHAPGSGMPQTQAPAAPTVSTEATAAKMKRLQERMVMFQEKIRALHSAQETRAVRHGGNEHATAHAAGAEGAAEEAHTVGRAEELVEEARALRHQGELATAEAVAEAATVPHAEELAAAEAAAEAATTRPAKELAAAADVAAEAAAETPGHRFRGMGNVVENSSAGEAAAAADTDAKDELAALEAELDELAALEAELESAGPQPSQHHEQPSTDFGVDVKRVRVR